jgi:AraC-like DNA-binding protein
MPPLEPKGFFQYLPRTQYDQVAGFYMTDFGWTEVKAGMPYPPWQHPSDFSSITNKSGRLLDEHQLVYITRGSGTFWSSATGTIQVKPGTVFLLFPGVRHKYTPDPATGWDEQWFGFKGDVAERLMEHYFSSENPIFEFGIKSEVLSLFDKIRDISQKQPLGYRRIMALTAQEILTRLHVSTQPDQEADIEIEDACQYIEEHFKGTIDFKQYAESTGQSYSTFRRRFKQYTGLAPNQYQLDTKLRNAKQFLDNTDLSIQDIAHECGFESPYYFSRYFKATTELSPKQYRARWEADA